MRWIFFPSIEDLIENTTFNWNFLAKVIVCTYVKFSISILGKNRTKKQKLRGHFALLAVIWHRTLSRNRGDFSNLQCAPKWKISAKITKSTLKNNMSSSCSTFKVLQWLKLKFLLNFSSLYFLVQISEPPLLWSKSFEKKKCQKKFFF